MERIQVLIAGAGPVGAVAAYVLAKAGIDVVLVEAATSVPQDMRASTIHPPTLQMLEDWGLLPELEAQGLRAPVYQYRNRGTGDVVAFDMGELADISAHPYRLQCEQFKIVATCTEKPELAGRVHFGQRLIWFVQDEEGVTATCETAYGTATYRADFLLGADGANSLVRKIIGVPFEGFTYPEKFLTLSTDYPVEDHFPGLANVSYVADAEEWYVLLRVPGLWRLLVPADPEKSDEELLSDAKKNEVFGGLLGIDASDIRTHHRTIYRVHQRVVSRYDHGRVVLLGDAAHLNNPLGGFGMNSGLHDAWNLVDKLKRVILDGEDYAPLFAQYDRQRRTIMHEFVQAQTIQNKSDMLNADQRQAKFEEVLADPVKRRNHLMRQSMYDSRAREAEIG